MANSIGPKIVLEGEKEYRKAISDINREQRVLSSEMKKVSAEFDGNANSIEALNKKNDVLNKEYDEQVKRIRTLQGALDNAKNVYGENSKEVDNWQIKLNNAEAELSKLDKELQSNEKYLDEAEKSTDGTAKSIDEYGKEVKEAGQETITFGDVVKANLTSQAIIGGVKALGGAIKGLSEGAVDLATDAAAYADDILTMSDTTRMATDTLQAYNYMAELTDVSMEVLTKSMAKNVKSMDNASRGTKLYSDSYDKLGVSVKDANGNLRDSEEVFWDSIDALGNMANETERDAIAMQLFGRSAQDLNPLMLIGSKGVAEFTAEAREMGAILDEDALNALGETDDAMQRLTRATEITKREFGLAMAPAVTRAATRITEKIGDMDSSLGEFAGGALETAVDGLEWVIDNSGELIGGISGIATGLAVFKAGSAIQTGMGMAVKAWKAYKKSTEGATVAQWAMNAAQSASPVGLIAAAVGLATGALIAYKLSAEDSTSETNLLSAEIERNIEASKKLNEEIKESSAQRKENVQGIEAEHKVAKDLSRELFNLSEKENKTNAEKRKMVVVVDQLNELMPELNLSIDEETGLLNKNESQINKLIDTNLRYAKVKAAQEDLIRIAEEQYEAEKQLWINRDDHARVQEELTTVQEKHNETFRTGVGIVWSASKAERERVKTQKETGEQIRELKDREEELNGEMENTQETINLLGAEFDQTSAYIDEFGYTAEETSGQITEANTEVAESIKKMQEEYENALMATAEKIYDSMGLFDEFAKNTELSGEQLLKNLQGQVEGMRDWSENLQELSKKGIEEGLLQELYDMGPKAAGEIQALNKMTNEELEEYNEAWRDKTRIAAEAASLQTEDMMTDIEEELNKLSPTTRQAVMDALEAGKSESANSKDVGEELVNGMTSGVSSRSWSLNSAVRGVAQGAIDAAKKKLGIHSPSKVFEEIGEFSAEGYGLGFVDKMDKVNRELAFAMPGGDLTTSFDLEQSQNLTSEVNHTGIIRVEGVNSEGEFVSVVDIIMDKLRGEARL